jgi:hypothetical protein
MYVLVNQVWSTRFHPPRLNTLCHTLPQLVRAGYHQPSLVLSAIAYFLNFMIYKSHLLYTCLFSFFISLCISSLCLFQQFLFILSA